METDLWVHAPASLKEVTRELILQYRGYLDAYINEHPEFVRALHPVRIKPPAPAIVREMASAAEAAGVGP